MKYAVLLHRNYESVVTGFTVISYVNYVTEVKNLGHKPALKGLPTNKAAYRAARKYVGKVWESDKKEVKK